MISDVLSEALNSIDEYQAGFPDSYTDFREEIEQVKLTMTRLLIRLDTPPEMTAEMWAEAMVKVAENDREHFRNLIANRIYHVRRQQVIETLGPDHPMLVSLRKAEEVGEDREAELAEALESYTDPTHSEYDPDFDRQIRTLRPDWFDKDSRA